MLAGCQRDVVDMLASYAHANQSVWYMARISCTVVKLEMQIMTDLLWHSIPGLAYLTLQVV